MEEIEWNVKIGKKEVLQNFRNPMKIFTLLAAFVYLFYLFFELATNTSEEFSIPISATILVVLLFLVIIAFYSYKTNKELFKDEVRNYKINTPGVTINGKLYAWSNYKYFQDDARLVESVSSGMLSPMLASQPINRWIIQLLVGKYTDKNKLLLVIDNKDIYNKVREVVKEKFKESSSIK